MEDELDPSATEGASPPGDAAPERTVEAVEAEYRARLSGKDKAHAAERAALEARLASLDEQIKQREVGTMDEVEKLRAENARLAEQAKAAEERARAESLVARRTRFPTAAESLGDELVATMDEERLSALESRLAGATPGDGGMILTNAARRPAGDPQKPIGEKTSAELRADLARFSAEGFDNRQ